MSVAGTGHVKVQGTVWTVLLEHWMDSFSRLLEHGDP